MIALISNLKNVALDYAVARAKHLTPTITRDKWFPFDMELRGCRSDDGCVRTSGAWAPTVDYALAHKLMVEANLTVIAPDTEVDHWTALKHKDGQLIECAGKTSQEAIARCFATIMLGTEATVPDEVFEASLAQDD